MKPVLRVIALCLLGACGAPKSQLQDSNAVSQPGSAPEQPDSQNAIPPSPEREASRPEFDLTDPPEGMTLRLPLPCTPRQEVLGRQNDCSDNLHIAEDGSFCAFHGWIRPLVSSCEDGCTWWTYHFNQDHLLTAELKRALWDVDEEAARLFMQQAESVATELTNRVGTTPQVESGATWQEVESSPDGTKLMLRRLRWSVGEVELTWRLIGQAAHHPGILLYVELNAAETVCQPRQPAQAAPVLPPPK